MPNRAVMPRKIAKNLNHRFLDEFERPLPRLKYGAKPDMRHESSWRRQILSRCRAERRISWRGRPGLGLSCLKRRSQFGIHDVSRVELDESNKLPRFNMPLELGLFLGAKSFSDEARQKKKRCLILDSDPHR
jgi:hypothetical protein